MRRCRRLCNPVILASFALVAATAMAVAAAIDDANIPPTWEELDQRELPKWYDEAKFGIFIHWGVFSVPSMYSEWFWNHWQSSGDPPNEYQQFVNRTEAPNFHYQEYATRFHAELYDPELWADVFAKSGAQYVVLTSKHHEGFCNWDSRDVPGTWNWNAMDIGPKRDILGDLAKAVKKRMSPMTLKRLRFGVYHSLYEWFNPMYLADKKSNFTSQQFIAKTMAELHDLVVKYEPEIIWSDGDWEASDDYWKSREFLQWYSTNSTVNKTGVWNDRWGRGITCKHGGFLTCADRYNPGRIQKHKWENAFTMDKGSWGWNRNATLTQYLTVKELVHTMIQVVAFNGNVLINVGPGADGTLSPIFLDRLRGIGNWLSVNGEAIYGTRPWKVCQNETDNVYYTTKEDRLYVLLREWPIGNTLDLVCPTPTNHTRVRFLGLSSSVTTNVHWSEYAVKTSDIPMVLRNLQSSSGIRLTLPALTPNIIPCEHAWVLELTGLEL